MINNTSGKSSAAVELMVSVVLIVGVAAGSYVLSHTPTSNKTVTIAE